MNWLRSLDWTGGMHLLAQAAPEGAEPAPAGGAGGAPAGPGSLTEVLLSPFNFMLMIFVLFFLIVLWPQQRQMKAQQRALAEALSNLKKNDRVITTGGIHGTVVQTAPDAGTVTLRIDETSGAKMTVGREAIARVVSSEAKTS
ncbi:MAG: preprotein translocase subunit YajC [Aureliella sp.]